MQSELLHDAPGHSLALRKGNVGLYLLSRILARVVREQDRGRGLVGGRVLYVQAVAD